jgi:VWFA-related protein
MTALYDAMAASLVHLNAGTRDRKALVVLSDGGDNASSRSLEGVLEIAKRSNATIYTIGIYDESNMDRNPGVLRRIAELSGGQAFFPDSPNDLERVWRDVAGAIRSQYTIGYHSTDRNRDGKFRKVEITAGRNNRRDLRVVTRDGYIAPAVEGIVK